VVKIEGDVLHLSSSTPIMAGGKKTMSYSRGVWPSQRLAMGIGECAMADENKERVFVVGEFAFERMGCQIVIADRVTYRAAILELLQGNPAAMTVFRNLPGSLSDDAYRQCHAAGQVTLPLGDRHRHFDVNPSVLRGG
jgi:hypothetical protein